MLLLGIMDKDLISSSIYAAGSWMGNEAYVREAIFSISNAVEGLGASEARSSFAFKLFRGDDKPRHGQYLLKKMLSFSVLPLKLLSGSGMNFTSL